VNIYIAKGGQDVITKEIVELLGFLNVFGKGSPYCCNRTGHCLSVSKIGSI
jgi:hypothetical protein